MRRLIRWFALGAVLAFAGCDDARCELAPQAGPCKASIERYYYDSSAQECRPFIWGGCDGVVPFDTLAACESACE